MNTTPVLPLEAARCRPAQPCAKKYECARFQAEIAGGPLQTVGCAGFLDPAAFVPKPVKAVREVKTWPKEDQ